LKLNKTEALCCGSYFAAGGLFYAEKIYKDGKVF